MAQRRGVSKGEWVRQAIEGALRGSTAATRPEQNPLSRLSTLKAPTADIEDMLDEIEADRS